MGIDFVNISTPLILGTASLAAFASVRDINISERIRSIDKEVADRDTLPSRRKNLVSRQLVGLKRRYRAVNLSLLMFVCSFVAYVAMDIMAGLSRQGATAAFGVGAVLCTVGFVLMVYEITEARVTLFADTEYAEQMYAAQEHQEEIVLTETGT